MLQYGASHGQDECANLRCQAGANESKELITMQISSQSTFSTSVASSSSTLATMDTEATESSDSFDQVGGSVGSDSAGEIIMTIQIVGTKVIDGVVYYRLDTPISPGMVSSVWRRYSDFVKLDNQIAASRCSRRAVPITRGFLPGAEVLGVRRSLTGDRFLQRRQDMLQQYLDVIAAQWPVSSQDHHVQEFLHQGASNEVREQDLTQPFEQEKEELQLDAIEAFMDLQPELKAGLSFESYEIEYQIAGAEDVVLVQFVASAGRNYHEFVASMTRSADGEWSVSKVEKS
jgi:hypothetical protein